MSNSGICFSLSFRFWLEKYSKKYLLDEIINQTTTKTSILSSKFRSLHNDRRVFISSSSESHICSVEYSLTSSPSNIDDCRLVVAAMVMFTFDRCPSSFGSMVSLRWNDSLYYLDDCLSNTSERRWPSTTMVTTINLVEMVCWYVSIKAFLSVLFYLHL